MSSELADDLVEEHLRPSAEHAILVLPFSLRFPDCLLKVFNGPVLVTSIRVELLQDLDQLPLLSAQDFNLGAVNVRNDHALRR